MNIINYCSILTQTKNEVGKDIYRIIIVQIQKGIGRVYDIHEISVSKGDIISIPQIGMFSIN